jgi:N-acetylmuramoyl-L-alanine amidase
LADLTPTTDAGIRKRDDLGALNQTIAVAVILEVSFHDNLIEAKWIHDNPVPIDVRISNGFYKFLNQNKLI